MDDKELEALKTSNPKQYDYIVGLKTSAAEAEKTKKELEELRAKSKKDEPPPKDDLEKDLRAKALKEKEGKESKDVETRRLEKALQFNLTAQDFVKNNKDLLPNEVEDIMKQADKEKYDSAFERANVVKKSIMEAFFAIQANLDLLTPSQKSQVDDFLKLSMNGKLEKAEGVYENIFEPTLETVKKVKKAVEVGRSASGFAAGTKAEDAYKEKMIQHSRKAHLGEKGAK